MASHTRRPARLTPPPRHARRGDEGASLVEFALIAPFLVLLLLGALEFGLAWRARLDVETAVSLAARQASNLGDGRPADYEALQSLVGTIENKNLTITKIVIYRATGSAGEPSNPNCFTNSASPTGTGISGACNIYHPDQFNNLVDNSRFGPGATDCDSGEWDRFWCPPNRESSQGGPPDYLGVLIEAELDATTNLFGDTFTITERGVLRLEPDPE